MRLGVLTIPYPSIPMNNSVSTNSGSADCCALLEPDDNPYNQFEPTMVSPCKLRVLSLNIWGLHYIDSTHIKERLVHMAEEIKQYDLVGLQEVWKREDFEYLVKELGHILPYHHYFHSGAIGSGLCIFSRHPIMCPHGHSFSVSGSIGHFFDGELFAGKGIMMCRILTPSGPIAFYCTHLNPRQRDSQIYEIYKFVDQTRGQDPVIMTGDYNTKPTHHAYQFLTSSLLLEDAFSNNPVDTCDLRTNIFTKKHMTPKRIDYVFHSDRKSSSISLTLQDSQLALTGNIPGKSIPYSDHEGLEAMFQLELREQDTSLTIQEMWLDDSQVQCFLHLANSISAKQTEVKTTARRIVVQWVLIGLFTFLLGLGLNFFIHLLVPFSMGWVLLEVMAIVGGLGGFAVVSTVANAKACLALEANLSEIRTLLKFNTVAKAMANYTDLNSSVNKKSN